MWIMQRMIQKGLFGLKEIPPFFRAYIKKKSGHGFPGNGRGYIVIGKKSTFFNLPLIDAFSSSGLESLLGTSSKS